MKTSKINDSKLLDLIRSNKLSLNAPWKLFKIPLSLLKKKFLTFNDTGIIMLIINLFSFRFYLNPIFSKKNR